MSFRSVFIGRVHIVLWHRPDASDVDQITREVRSKSLQLGQKLVGVSMVPEKAKPPGAEARVAMAKGLQELFKYVDKVYFVMEGSGFISSVNRSIVTGAFMIGSEKGRITVCSSFEEAAERFLPAIGIPRAEFFRKVSESNIFRHFDEASTDQ
jgi:hypothetical protein